MASSSRYPMMDCYRILEISPDASLKDINSAYKKLALKYHPDKTGGDDAAIEFFQKIQEAVEILRDPITRQAHDKEVSRRYRYPTEEDLIFASSEYTGWRPQPRFQGSNSRDSRDRYMFSYSESVHMNPSSSESQEELARCEQTRKEKAEEQEKIRRDADIFAEVIKKEEGLPRRGRVTVNPEAETSTRGPGTRGLYKDGVHDGIEPIWWAGAEPNGVHHDVFEASADAGNGVTGEADADPQLDSQVEAEVTLESGFRSDARLGSGRNAAVGADPNAGIEVDVDAVPGADAGNGSEVEPVVITEPGFEYHAEFDIGTVLTEPSDATDDDIEYIPTTENVPQVNSEHDDETNTDVDITSEDASVYTASLQPALAESMSLPTKTMNGALSPSSSEAQFKVDAYSTSNAGHESAESIYYDFSDAAPPQSGIEKNETYHDLSTDYDNMSNPFSDNSPIPQLPDIAEFNEANVYPYLVPFIPYFTNKLTNRSGQYSREDFQAELRGMIMETYCGWLETIRVMIPGAAEPANVRDLRDCRHLGYWEKELGHESCEVCGLWKPIYTLKCSGCGIKKCVRCKFEEGR